jgi:hypothetical protein
MWQMAIMNKVQHENHIKYNFITRMTMTQDNKAKLVERILENPVYTTDSGLVCMLRKDLLKLSGQTLAALEILIQQKIHK